MNTLIVFYSWTGHTGTVAWALGQKLGCTVIRIEPAADPGKHIARMGMKAAFGMRADIQSMQLDLTGIDHLVVATPVWAHNLPPFVREYLEDLTNCSGKKFSVLAEMGGSGGESVVKKVRKILEAKGMKFVASAVTIEKDVEERKVEGTIGEFAKKIQEG